MSATPAPAPAASPGLGASEPTTIEDAQAQIERARSALEAPATGGEPQPLDAQSGRCAEACRAIASMHRAVDALCRMSGDADDRCRDARDTLARSEARVVRCGC